MRLIRDYAPGDDRDAALVGLEDWPQPKSVRDASRRLGGNGVMQRRFNVSVPRARVPAKASTRRERSEG